MTSDIEQALTVSPALARLGPERIRRLAAIGELVSAAAGATVVQQGATGSSLYLIVNGEALVTLPDGSTNTLHPGEVFGEMGALFERPRVATVTAQTPLKLVLFRKEPLLALSAEMEELLEILLQIDALRSD